MLKKTPPPFCRGLSRSLFPVTCAALLAATAPQAAFAAATSWLGGDGSWTDESKWNAGLPAGDLDARFDNGAVDSAVTLGDGLSVSFATLEVRRQQVSITLGSGSSMTATSVLIGLRAGFAGHLSFFGPETGTANLDIGGITVGQPSTNDGNSITFSGSGLDVQATSRRTIIGRGSAANELQVLDGARVALHSFRIGYLENSADNKITVSGEGSRLSVANGSGDSVEIGAGVGVGVNGSELLVSGGGEFTSSSGVRISQMAETHSNGITVTGAGSKFVMTSGATVTIGASSTPVGAGGSFVRLSEGGQMETDGNVTIFGHDVASTVAYGSNGLLIGADSTFTQSAGSLSIGENALLRLESGGTLVSPNVQVAGRFEAEGSGLQAATLTIAGGGVLAIGVDGGTTAQQLNVNQSVTLASGSFLEVGLFGSGEMDRLHLDSGGTLSLGSGVTLRLTLSGYDPVLNDSWTLVDGNTAGVSGEFALFEMPELQGGLSWDLSNLNEAGGWRVAVIPEPGTWFLTGLGGLALLAFRRRKSKMLPAVR